MKDLIEALTILLQYKNPKFPTCCEHDVLTVVVDPLEVAPADLSRLEELGFFVGGDEGQEDGSFYSYRFGSC